ncbi:MAG: nuclear transport factor 2 family protein, partial [Chloroflexi bacterium]|nr:nuclear transport factor 2 family protein [Chloroflexota bacterium]
GVIRSDGVHEGDSAYVGTGPSAGQELRLHQYMGPGADTSAGDSWELTGWHDTIDVPGWTFDPASTPDPTAMIAALVKAWDAGNGAAAAALYAPAATLVDATGSSVMGRDAIAALVTEAAGSGIHRELVDAVLVRGNIAVAGVQLSEGGHDTIQMVVLRFDDAGLVVQHEAIGS